MLIKLLAVAAGGALGSVGRYLVGLWALAHFGPSRFPISTFLVNILGCLAAGILAGLVVRYGGVSEQLRLFLVVGLAGGFTTFSAFGLETFELIKREQWMLAMIYVLTSLVLGVLMVVLGFLFTAQAWR